MKINALLMMPFFIFIFSCQNEIPKEKLTVINSIVLGQSINNAAVTS
jgi:hypothetical protein